ncbi:hypothetical protein NIES4101_78300 [Calothrix sp. NIES-4101]|nr:hypothetical protein NIES4101_78300 [Calothrix sp. NIES-4101]
MENKLLIRVFDYLFFILFFVLFLVDSFTFQHCLTGYINHMYKMLVSLAQ